MSRCVGPPQYLAHVDDDRFARYIIVTCCLFARIVPLVFAVSLIAGVATAKWPSHFLSIFGIAILVSVVLLIDPTRAAWRRFYPRHHTDSPPADTET